MRQDSDVARVAAAMNAPGFKYRSFGNEPVRIRPGAAGTLAQPPAETAGFTEESASAAPDYAPLGYIDEPAVLPMDLPAVAPRMIDPLPPEPPAYEDTPAARFAYDSFPEPLPEPAVEPVALRADPEPLLPEPPPPAAPLFSWPETAANPPPAPPVAASPPPLVPGYAPTATPPQAPLSAGGFRLLESMGHRAPESTGLRPAEPAAGGTLALLRRAAESTDRAGASTAGFVAGLVPGGANGGPMPPLSPSGHQSGLLPAAAVTVPLSDVMRLIAAGATPPPSPFDAFRAALGAQPVR